MKFRGINLARFGGIIFFSVLLADIIIRVCFLHHKTLWLDEAYSVFLLRSDLKMAKDLLLYVQGNFLGYWLIGHPFIKLFPDLPIEITLRAPSLIADILSMIIFYKIVKRLRGVKFARISTLFYSLHPVLIWHSLDGRFYSIFLLLCLLSIFVLINIKERQKGWFLWSLLTGIIPYFHYYGYFFIFLLGSTLFFFYPTLFAESRRRLLLKFIPVFIILAPSLALFYNQSQNISSPSLILEGQNLKDMLLFILLSLFGNFHQEYLSFIAPALLFFVILIAIFFSDNRFRKIYLLIFLLILLVPTITHYFTKIFFHSRFVIFSIPFFIFVTLDLITNFHRIFKGLILFAFILNFLYVDYFTITDDSSRPFTRKDLVAIEKLPGTYLFVPGAFAMVFDAYKLIESRTKVLCFPDASNKKEINIMLNPKRTSYTVFLLPEECSNLKKTLEKEEMVNLIFSSFLRTRDLMFQCVEWALKSFQVKKYNKLSSGILVIQLQREN